MDQRSSYSYSLQQSALGCRESVLFCDHDICMKMRPLSNINFCTLCSVLTPFKLHSDASRQPDWYLTWQLVL